MHLSLARIADDDPCACARDTVGEYAYTKQGLLKEEFLILYISMNLQPHKSQTLPV